MPAPSEIQRQYDRHAWIYDWSRAAFLFGRGELVRWVAETLPTDREVSVCEVGCGTGRNLSRLIAERSSHPIHVIGIDLSHEMLKRATRRCHAIAKDRRGTRLSFLQGDATELISGLNAPIDAVICSYVLTLIPDPRPLFRALQIALNPEGVIGVVDFVRATGLARRWLNRYGVLVSEDEAPLWSQLSAVCAPVRLSDRSLWTPYRLWLGKSKRVR